MKIPNIATDTDMSDQLDILADFISSADNEYGAGMDKLAIAYLNREKALKGRCSFFDPYYVNGNVPRLKAELLGQYNSILLTNSVDVYGDDNLAPTLDNRDLFKNTINAINHAGRAFDKIFIPVGCIEEGKPGHNIAVVLEKKQNGYKATIIDQMGGSSYTDTKAKMIIDLRSAGIVDIDYNRNPISVNRNDCATFTSLFAEMTCDNGNDMRELIKGADRNYNNGILVVENFHIDIQKNADKKILHDSALRLAEDLIKERYQVDDISKLRWLSDVPTPEEIVSSRKEKMTTARTRGNSFGKSLNSYNDYYRR